MKLRTDSDSEIVLAKLILKLKQWSYDLFPEGDYSDSMSELTEWAENKIEEIEE